MSDKLIKITGINCDYFMEDKNHNSFKVHPIVPVDKNSSKITKEHEEIKKQFERLLEAEIKKLK
jgi:hypothetical protein